MHTVRLRGCTATPFGSYLKALGVLRLVCEQSNAEATGRWVGDTFEIRSALTEGDLATFFVERYAPTPILAPWNGGSGFYPKDNQDGINAISGSTHERFAGYRDAIAVCREFDEVRAGKSADEDSRRTAILRRCRNGLNDRAVEWLDAAVGIAADGSRSFAPVLGTGGNEGRLDYTNNFMARIAALLIAPSKGTPVAELLRNSLYGERTSAFQAGAAGQYDPGRAGGANQGPGIAHDSVTNPWDLVLSLEGAVAWASGLYRRQGASYRAVLCSPFTVRACNVGYGSAAGKDKGDARAEIWAPIWRGQVRYEELKALLREGRANVDGRPASTGLEFAEAARSLGVDRGIDCFVRYSLLKRRGDSYVALPAGTFATGYRSESDRIREFQTFFEGMNRRELPKGAEELRRGVDAAAYQVLLKGGSDRIRELMAALGRMIRRLITTSDTRPPLRGLKAENWLRACGLAVREVRIAAALASIFTREVGAIADNLSRADSRFAWSGADLPARLISVLERRLQVASATESDTNPMGGAFTLRPGEVTSFIEGSVDDQLIEDLLFAFVTLDWTDFDKAAADEHAGRRETIPVYAVLKHLFLPGEIKRGTEAKRLVADSRIVSLLKAGHIDEAARMAVTRLQVAGFRPIQASYLGGMDPQRLAASLLIPVRAGKTLQAGIFHDEKDNS